MSFISTAFASDAASQTSSILTNLMPIALIMVVFYFLLLRPQQKKMKEHQLLIKSLEKGNEVYFSGGIMGLVVKTDDEVNVTVEIAPEVRIKIRRDSVTEVIKNTGSLPSAKVDIEKKPIKILKSVNKEEKSDIQSKTKKSKKD